MNAVCLARLPHRLSSPVPLSDVTLTCFSSNSMGGQNRWVTLRAEAEKAQEKAASIADQAAEKAKSTADEVKRKVS